MRNLKGILFLSLTCLFMSGCFNNKVICTMTEDDTKSEMVGTFKSDKLTKVEGKMIMTTDSEEAAKQTKEYSSLFTTAFEKMGMESNVSTKGKDVIIKFSGDIKDIEEKAKEADSDFDYSGKTTKKEFKDSLEEDGYKCK